MLAWYKAEGNFNDSAGSNNGSASGTVNFVPGIVSQAFSFAGASFVTVPASSGPLNLTGTAVTIDGWIQPVNRTTRRSSSGRLAAAVMITFS